MVATMIAGIGVLLDQPILIVGAMVVGPEFGPLAALCVALLRRQPRVAGRSVQALTVGFLVAMAATVLSTWALTAAGLVGRDMLLAERPLTDFIWRPDALSWVVGLLAGIAGMLSLTSKKSGSLVGVLISVTTVPAAANVAVASAYGVVARGGRLGPPTGDQPGRDRARRAAHARGAAVLVAARRPRAARPVPRQRADQRPAALSASRRPRRGAG
ncbi:DUF389 domain-containing protein [Micromonospora sp. BRA006-A]|nr:DUF389 domain-containing protein [Micromonospora sp. BRA006-A]